MSLSLVCTRIYVPEDQNKNWSIYEGFDYLSGRTVSAVGPRSAPFDPSQLKGDYRVGSLPKLPYRFRLKGGKYKAYIIDK